MKQENNKISSNKTKTKSNEGIGIRTDLDSEHLFDTTDRYAGDSVNEHKSIEKVNEHFADEEIEQQKNNL